MRKIRASASTFGNDSRFAVAVIVLVALIFSSGMAVTQDETSRCLLTEPDTLSLTGAQEYDLTDISSDWREISTDSGRIFSKNLTESVIGEGVMGETWSPSMPLFIEDLSSWGANCSDAISYQLTSHPSPYDMSSFNFQIVRFNTTDGAAEAYHIYYQKQPFKGKSMDVGERSFYTEFSTYSANTYDGAFLYGNIIVQMNAVSISGMTSATFIKGAQLQLKQIDPNAVISTPMSMTLLLSVTIGIVVAIVLVVLILMVMKKKAGTYPGQRPPSYLIQNKPQQGAIPGQPYTYCPECGAQTTGTPFCGLCGRRLI